MPEGIEEVNKQTIEELIAEKTAAEERVNEKKKITKVTKIATKKV